MNTNHLYRVITVFAIAKVLAIERLVADDVSVITCIMGKKML